MTLLLTKSLFMRGYDCPVRLSHALEGRPSSSSEDDFLRMLAEGGMQFERIVHTAWPGELLGGTSADAAASHQRTLERLRSLKTAGGGVLHEACFVHDGRFARVDLLRVTPSRVEVCEIKATSVEGPADPVAGAELQNGTLLMGTRGEVDSKRLGYVADLAFQIGVVEGALRVAGLGHWEIHPRLIVLNKNAPATAWDSFGNFSPVAGSEVDILSPPAPGTRSPLILEIDASEPVRKLRMERARSRSVQWKDQTLDAIAAEAVSVARGTLTPDPRIERGWKCRDCEFNADPSEGVQTGFDLCWGKGADAARGLLELHYGSGYKGRAAAAPDHADWVEGAVAAELATDRKGHPIGRLTPERGGESRPLARALQIQAVRTGKVQYAPGFPTKVRSALRLPSHNSVLHFLDFEAAASGLPLAPGMRPYEKLIFQFSVHSLPWKGQAGQLGDTRHAEFLNESTGDPGSPISEDRALLDALQAVLGADQSPVYHWSPYEVTALKVMKARLESTGIPQDAPRIQFIDALVGGADGRGGRLVDLLRAAEGNLFSPHQKGRYSIKALLPAICLEPEPRAAIEALMGWDPQTPAEGELPNPYDRLAALMPSEGLGEGEAQEEQAVRDGTDAMRAFQRLRFPHLGLKDPPPRAAFADALRSYCKLDTAAMVAVWVWLDNHRRRSPEA
jgi:hypothetical protein